MNARDRRRFVGSGPFDFEQRALAHGATIESVTARLFGNDVEGLRWQLLVHRFLDHCSVRRGRVQADPARHSDATRRALLSYVLRVLSEMRRCGSMICAQGREVAEGRDRKRGELVTEDGEWIETDEYIPARSTSNLAARARRAPRTIRRWKRISREAGIFGIRQPKRHEKDAIVPRKGDYAYGRFWPATELPPLTLRRLRIWWGELKPSRPEPIAPSPKLAKAEAPALRPTSQGPPELPPYDPASLIEGAELVIKAAKGRAAHA